jgi:hopanoid biosynthesis associated protein HpnK
LHLVLVEGRPVSAPEHVPDLVDKAGLFRPNVARAGAAMFFLPHVRRQLAVEIEAQFAAFAASGLKLDHVNAHLHFHLHPTIAHLIASIGPRFGVVGARGPVEPRAILHAIEPERVSDLERLIEPFARALRRRFRAAGMVVPDQVFGLRWSGAMNRTRLVNLIERLPEGLTEIYSHPARAGGFAGAAEGYRYADELAAILAPDAIAAAGRAGLRCGGYADFDAGASSVESARRHARC